MPPRNERDVEQQYTKQTKQQYTKQTINLIRYVVFYCISHRHYMLNSNCEAIKLKW